MKIKKSKVYYILIFIISFVVILSFFIEANSIHHTTNFELNQGNVEEENPKTSNISELTLDIDDIDYRKNIVEGKFDILAYPRRNISDEFLKNNNEPERTLGTKKGKLEFNDFGGRSIGKSSGFFDFEVNRDKSFQESITANGEFTISYDNSDFWYPFEEYKIKVNPDITTPFVKGLGAYYISTDEVKVNLNLNNFKMSDVKIEGKTNITDGDKVYIRLVRPLPIKFLMGLFYPLSFAWLLYLYYFFDVKDKMSDLLTFFIGIWGFRETFMKGIDIFPSFYDYYSIILAIIAVLIILVKSYRGKFVAKKLAE